MKNSIFEKLKIIDSTKSITENKLVKKLKSFFGLNTFENREFNLEQDESVEIDDLIRMISKAKKTDGYIARTSNSILQKSLKTGWFFESKKDSNATKIEEKFYDLLLDSGLNPRSFVRQLLKNLIDYSNVFIFKKYSEDKKLESLCIFPSKGWKPLKVIGEHVLEWEFSIGEKSLKFSDEQVVHIHYNKETHEIFGTPFMSSVLEDVQLLRNIESASIEDYWKYLSKKTIIQVGEKNSPGSQKEIEAVQRTLSGLDADEDLVVSSRVNVKIIEPSYHSPDFILGTMRERALAGLLSSNSQMGMSGNGRQDADTQETRESITVEDFQENLEDQLNNSIIKELVLECYGVYNYKNAVFFKFRKSQNDYERANNHFLNLYNSGVISFDELRNKIQMPVSDFKEENSINAINFNYEEKTAKLNNELQLKLAKQNSINSQKSVSKPKSNTGAQKLTKSLNQPSNQHGTNPNSKKSVKN